MAVFRVAVLWFLINREWTHHQSIATLPLVLLLYPEALLLPPTVAWTTTVAFSFSAALIAGSFLWAGILTVAVSLKR